MMLVPLTRGMAAMVDDEDYARVSLFKWQFWPDKNGKPYAKRSFTISKGVRRTIGMHQYIMGIPIGNGMVIDHKDGNGLNMQKKNLRFITQVLNRKQWQERYATKKKVEVGFGE